MLNDLMLIYFPDTLHWSGFTIMLSCTVVVSQHKLHFYHHNTIQYEYQFIFCFIYMSSITFSAQTLAKLH